MRRRIRMLLCASFLLLAGCVSSGKFQAKVEEAGRYQDEAADLMRRMNEISQSLDGLAAAYDSLQVLTDQMSGEKNALAATNKSLRETLDASLNEKDQLILRLTAEKQALAEEMAALQAHYNAINTQMQKEQQEQARRMAEMQSTYGQLVSGLQQQIAQGQIIVDSLAGKLTVHIVDRVLFRSGEAIIQPEGLEVLSQVAEAFNNSTGQRIIVEGHTDNVPIGQKLQVVYPTNWELSTARATNVVRYLIEQRGMDPKLVSVSGYGEFKPADTNTTEEGRARNRRIEILFIPLD
jgi:chemotaxis protein MotB